MNRTRAAVVVAVATLALAACGNSPEEANPPAPAATSAPAAPASAEPSAAGTVVDVAASDPDFSTLVSAIKAAGLAETLGGSGPFTVFAPTNEAFEALPAGLLDKLLEPANKEALTKILTYHVIPAEVMAADVTAGEVATVEGSEVGITTDDGVKVDEATVVRTDIDASNGVIHVIDKVLVPADVDPSKL